MYNIAIRYQLCSKTKAGECIRMSKMKLLLVIVVFLLTILVLTGCTSRVAWKSVWGESEKYIGEYDDIIVIEYTKDKTKYYRMAGPSIRALLGNQITIPKSCEKDGKTLEITKLCDLSDYRYLSSITLNNPHFSPADAVETLKLTKLNHMKKIVINYKCTTSGLINGSFFLGDFDHIVDVYFSDPDMIDSINKINSINLDKFNIYVKNRDGEGFSLVREASDSPKEISFYTWINIALIVLTTVIIITIICLLCKKKGVTVEEKRARIIGLVLLPIYDIYLVLSLFSTITYSLLLYGISLFFPITMALLLCAKEKGKAPTMTFFEVILMLLGLGHSIGFYMLNGYHLLYISYPIAAVVFTGCSFAFYYQLDNSAQTLRFTLFIFLLFAVLSPLVVNILQWGMEAVLAFISYIFESAVITIAIFAGIGILLGGGSYIIIKTR